MTGDPLRVLLVNKNAQGGGAERVALSLHEGLRRSGHDSWLAVARANLDVPGLLQIPQGAPTTPARRAARAVARAFDRGGRLVPRRRGLVRAIDAVAQSPANVLAERLGREPFDYPGTRALLSLVPGQVDILHAHNLHGRYFDLRQLSPLSRRVPVALTLHDEWTYTGHCAYTMTRETWRTGCHSCGDLDVYVPIARDATHANWEAKRRIYASSRLYVTAPSTWLLDRARSSVLATAVVDWRAIPNGVDRERFRPGDRAAARRLLDLPADAAILLFTANKSARNLFKDVDTVFAAARRLGGASRRSVLALALGDTGPAEVSGNVELRFVPYEPDQDRLAAHYRAADLYLHAARADNFPTTILEALASGVPVIATAVGGIPEAVRSLGGAPGSWSGQSAAPDAATGVLVDPGDAEGMAAAAGALLDDEPLRARLGSNAVDDVAARFDVERQLDSTIAWYREVMADWRAATRAT